MAREIIPRWTNASAANTMEYENALEPVGTRVSQLPEGARNDAGASLLANMRLARRLTPRNPRRCAVSCVSARLRPQAAPPLGGTTQWGGSKLPPHRGFRGNKGHSKSLGQAKDKGPDQ